MKSEEKELAKRTLLKNGKYEDALIVIENLLDVGGAFADNKPQLFLEKGTCFCRTGHYREALRAYTEGLDSLSETGRGDKVVFGKMLAGMGYAHFHMSEYSRSTDELGKAFEALRDTSENETIANIQKYLGWCDIREGRMKKARTNLEDSVAAYRRVRNYEEVAKLKNSLSHVCFLNFRWDAAIEHMNDAIEICKIAKDYRNLSLYLCNLSIMFMFFGNLQEAYHYNEKSLRLKKKMGGNLPLSRNYLVFGKLSALQRNFAESEEWLNKGLKLATERGMKREIAIGHEYLGELAFERGDYERAGLCYEEAREIAEAIAPEGDLINEIYRRIADLKVRTGDPKKAWEASERALAVSRSLGDRYEEALTIRARGMVLKERGKKEEALEHLEKCLKMLTSLGEKYEAARTSLEIGIMLGEDKNSEDSLARAGQHLEKARDIFEELGIDHYLGKVAIEMAIIHVASDEDRKVLECLDYAADLGKDSEDGDAIRIRIRDLKRSLEDAIVDRVLSSNEEVGPLAEITFATMGYSSNREGLEKIFFHLMKRVKADRGFIARRDRVRGDYMISISKGLAIPQSEAILSHIMRVDGRILSTRRPFLSIAVPGDSRLASIGGDTLFGVNSLAAVPFGVKGDAEGICYLDREAGMSKVPILFDGLKRMASFSRYLALFVAAIERDELQNDNKYLRHQLRRKLSLDGIITQDPEMFKLLERVDRVKDSSIPALLLGETGTGKELFARAIHFSGVRRNKQYIAVNCAALPDNLLESELFGHRKGAFTGATTDKKGLFEVTNRGTFFLDEIADMGLSIQVKLLRFLESGEIMRLGDTATRKVDVRIIAATNRDLEAEIEAGRFRQDLFYRLDGVILPIPPLRDRRADIPILISHFIEKYSVEEKKHIGGVASDALNLLVSYDWPGNVRELLNEIRRAVTLAEDGDRIGLGLLSGRVKKQLLGGGESSDADEEGSTLPELMASFERQRIFMALKEAHWVKTRAARQLGIHEATLRGKMRRYSLETPIRND